MHFRCCAAGQAAPISLDSSRWRWQASGSTLLMVRKATGPRAQQKPADSGILNDAYGTKWPEADRRLWIIDTRQAAAQPRGVPARCVSHLTEQVLVGPADRQYIAASPEMDLVGLVVTAADVAD